MDNDIIVGLAGHIDHGKTSLIKALNGFDGDESPQEKERGITLDISFSHLRTPSRTITLIDVPGHHKLVKNMIAGAFGIDVLLLVIASDDGIMPQSIEHLEIANFLGIQKAICVITKVDLPQNLALRSQVLDLFARFSNISLEAILSFSIYEPKLRLELLNVLDSIHKPQKTPAHFFRYYIDRSFSLPGVGSVVSGGVVSGGIEVGQKVFVCELQRELQVRSLQMHHKNLSHASFSHRVGINLANIPSKKLKRGYLLTQRGFMRGFDRIDVVLYPLVKQDLHNLKVQFYIGTKCCHAKILVLQREQGQIFATLQTDKKIYSIFGERFVLRDEEKNIAGGRILCPITDPIKKSQKIPLLHSLLSKNFVESFGRILLAHKRGFGLICASQRFCLTQEEALKIAALVPNSVLDSKNLILYHQEALGEIASLVRKIYAKNPFALLSSKSLSSKIPWASPLILESALQDLCKNQEISKNKGLFVSKNNSIKDLQSYVREKLYENLLSCGKTPKAPSHLYALLDIDPSIGAYALKKLCKAQKITRLEKNVFLPTITLNHILKEMRDLLEKYHFLDLAILKKEWGISRKYLIAYLDYFDQFQDIKNQEGKRVLRYV
ncbi:selenocysteine-specific translation elongation factor [Helicobacter mustelae]|uniref:Selenocysteine-specific elongation factor n=1 Tax=Helicobacter mustelae (strain ATCC 43772 / CCUG 25715 / CIP 103759 / LMG 18044 / NCTC 12198 / R85-136P) TaxID=679897 RepID=D3UJJ2_HELM1|nr:selenocysteine-specific translation elongation factor [Helicobacter mustelae]CBG40668.1 putative selenocysteine-specific elongation factor [Helicobacter mustelae 12198]SQH72165.1 selenocysteine-specific elongation factor [Helicobacter mustelae]